MSALAEIQKKDGLEIFASEGTDIDGEWFKCSGKTGEWGIDSEPTDVTDIRICADLEQATAGEVRFGKNDTGNSTIVERHVARIVDQAPLGHGLLGEGLNPYTAFPGMRIHSNGALPR
jgi:hypothetical protein